MHGVALLAEMYSAVQKIFFFLISLCILSCVADRKQPNTSSDIAAVPQWAQEAIWYQIFVERFRNGDPSNDPRRIDMSGADPDFIPANWSVTDWGHDWYEKEPWQEFAEVENFDHIIQLRRFGGDLQGVLDKLDYIVSLGVNAIYFNPLNDAPSLHKFDARNWRHIDRNFGPDPDGDAEMMAGETPDDPETWQWTAADKLFLDLVEKLHQKGIRVIMDYSWNHTGTQFWAIKDLKEKGAASKYVDWFNVEQFDDPSTSANEFKYEGWSGYRYMPVVKKHIIPESDDEMPFEGNLVSEDLKNHIFSVTRRWLDPDGDGDPSDGVDGFRLDVAAEVPMGFWREYKKVVREVNPEAYLVGEIWWLEWPDKLLDPQQFLGDQFDAIMNYRWYRVVRSYFAQADPPLKPSQVVEGWTMLNEGIRKEHQRAMMNLCASHDSPRLGTSFLNKTQYKYQASPQGNPAYKIHQPDAATIAEMKMYLVHQYTFIGSPHIWYGDEVGMWGADDPACRKPMIWDDVAYANEKAHVLDTVDRPVNAIERNEDLLSFYRQMTALRNAHPVLAYGDMEFILADDDAMILAYRRYDAEDEIIVVFNRSDNPDRIEMPANGEAYREINGAQSDPQVDRDRLVVTAPPMTAIILEKM